MIIRDYEFSDSENLNLPTFDLTFPVAKTVLVDNEVVGVAYLRLTSEIGMNFKENLNRFIKARALNLLTGEIIPSLEKFGLADTQVFIEDPYFARYLINKYNFKRETEIPLYFTRSYNER